MHRFELYYQLLCTMWSHCKMDAIVESPWREVFKFNGLTYVSFISCTHLYNNYVHNKRLWSSQEVSTSFPGLFPLNLGGAVKIEFNDPIIWVSFTWSSLSQTTSAVACLTLPPLWYCWAQVRKNLLFPWVPQGWRLKINASHFLQTTLEGNRPRL